MTECSSGGRSVARDGRLESEVMRIWEEMRFVRTVVRVWWFVSFSMMFVYHCFLKEFSVYMTVWYVDITDWLKEDRQ